MIDPRVELRRMIADKVHVVDCGCTHPSLHTPDSLRFYNQVADAVLTLFDIVHYRTADRFVAYTHPTTRGESE